MRLRPLSQQQNKMTQSNPNLKTNNFFAKNNFACKIRRKVISPCLNQKPENLDSSIKPEEIINNLIKLKMEQCIETIGLEETLQTLDFLRQGGSLKEFLSKYQDSKHLCIAKHLEDIIQFSQV